MGRRSGNQSESASLRKLCKRRHRSTVHKSRAAPQWCGALLQQHSQRLTIPCTTTTQCSATCSSVVSCVCACEAGGETLLQYGRLWPAAAATACPIMATPLPELQELQQLRACINRALKAGDFEAAGEAIARAVPTLLTLSAEGLAAALVDRSGGDEARLVDNEGAGAAPTAYAPATAASGGGAPSSAAAVGSSVKPADTDPGEAQPATSGGSGVAPEGQPSPASAPAGSGDASLSMGEDEPGLSNSSSSSQSGSEPSASGARTRPC